MTRDASLAEDGLPPLRAVIARTGLSARKALGQNFLFDLNLTRRIARLAKPLDLVVEIGPGPGALTRALLIEGARHVVAVERDPRCLEALAEIAAHWPGRLSVIEGDALALDVTPHLAAAAASDQGNGPPHVQVVANLPYNIGTELLVRWLRGAPDLERWPSWWSQLTLMFQREVAERIVARPGDKAYGRLGVLAGWRAEARIAFDVSPRAFTPAPKVTSSVVVLRPTPPKAPCRLAALETVTAAAFSQRRKMLRGSLKSLGAPALLSMADIDETRRAETLSLEEFAALARAYDAARESAA